MQAIIVAVVFLLIFNGALAAEPAAESAAARSAEAEAHTLAREFVGLLKPKLKQAMAEGGPTNAIAVCADVAPGIADSLSAKSGWQVGRVSLKSRNASRAVPDPWEKAVLLEFDRRQAAGEAAGTLSYGEIVGKRYRYMQAQAVEPICLTCHGRDLADDVAETLRQYYPDDWATGYRMGEVRGAISLSGGL